MERTTFVSLVKSKGTIIVNQPITITENVKIGNTKKTTKKRRQIQYVDTLDTIYVDEQIKAMGGEKPALKPVYIVKGILSVDNENTSLLKFLNAHSDNKANGGRVFKELDVEKEDLFQVQQFQKTSKIQNAIMSGEEKVVRSVAVWFLGIKYLKLSINKIKKALHLKLQSDFSFVESVEKYLNDKSKDEKLLVTLALAEDVVKIVDGRKIAWFEGEELIYTGSNANDLVHDFSLWLKNDKEGREYLKLITDKME